MSTFDDNDIEFDFFDEPETVEATRRGRRRPRPQTPGGGSSGDGPRRPSMHAPTGIVPLIRLVGLIAIAIVVVVALVFWVGACQGKSKHDEYAAYAGKVRTLAQSSTRLGTEFATKLVSPGLKQSDLETSLQTYAQQEQQAYDEAQQIRPPGPLRSLHQRLADAIELRAKGLAGLGNALAQAPASKTVAATTAETDALTAQAQLLTASDVVWDQLYRLPATQQMKAQGVTGVVIPESHFISNPDLVSARSFGLLLTRLSGASSGGTPSGKHGDALVSVQANPGGVTLSTSAATTVKVSAGLTFVATVQDSGDFQEVSVPVTLTISIGKGTPILKRHLIPLIQPAHTATVTFGNFNLPTNAFGAKATVTVNVGAVPGEINTSNNKAGYTVFFTLS
ncbi:MAG: hypothetical protein ABSB24_00415 [Gaiellaceae bacterium]|jgi:hypothetical protein